jgi:hypothetical protein
LGGHDHSSISEKIGNVYIIKSGCDFEEFSDISVDITNNEVTKERVLITE